MRPMGLHNPMYPPVNFLSHGYILDYGKGSIFVMSRF
jgi:hypothetical protein